MSTLPLGTVSKAEFLITYDNNRFDDRLKVAWGFSCLININGVSILFDTGGDPKTLRYNMDKLLIDIKSIDVVVLSHFHVDHVGGLYSIIKSNNDVRVYAPSSFSSSFKKKIQNHGCEVIEVRDYIQICEGVASTGELGVAIKEQSLLVNTPKGLVVVTGCSHPGILRIIKKAKELTGTNIHLVMGGYHITTSSLNEMTSLIRHFQDLGVEKVGPCHCSGDIVRTMFKQAYTKDFIEVGVGKIYVVSTN